MTKALIVVDVQNDFMMEGSLAVKGAGRRLVNDINAYAKNFEHVIATQDWHPENHISFGSQWDGHALFTEVTYNSKKQMLWPDHCVQNTHGADFHWALDVNPKLIIRKGWNRWIDSYSAFYDNARNLTGLHGYFKELFIQEIHVCGLALDYCVKATALDAKRLLPATRVVIPLDLTQAVNQDEEAVGHLIVEFGERGVEVI